MHFCPKCGMVLKVVKKEGNYFGKCVNGHEIPLLSKDLVIRIDLTNTKERRKESVILVDTTNIHEENTDSGITCPTCGSNKCKIISSFTMYADEDQVVIVKCLECKRNFRLDSGVSGGT